MDTQYTIHCYFLNKIEENYIKYHVNINENKTKDFHLFFGF